jgi:hypothetical protein
LEWLFPARSQARRHVMRSAWRMLWHLFGVPSTGVRPKVRRARFSRDSVAISPRKALRDDLGIATSVSHGVMRLDAERGTTRHEIVA